MEDELAKVNMVMGIKFSIKITKVQDQNAKALGTPSLTSVP